MESSAPSNGPTDTYVVDAGDTLSGIAASYGLSLNELVEVNEWSDGANHAIFPGDVIALPGGAVAVSTTRPPSNNVGDEGDDDAIASGSGDVVDGSDNARWLHGDGRLGPTLVGVTMIVHRTVGRRRVPGLHPRR